MTPAIETTGLTKTYGSVTAPGSTPTGSPAPASSAVRVSGY
jgi:hypothetical protein